MEYEKTIEEVEKEMQILWNEVDEKTKFMFDNDISLVLSTRKGRFDGNVTNETFLLIN